MIGTTLRWSRHVQTFLSCLSSLCRMQKVLNPDLTLDSLTESPWPCAGLGPRLLSGPAAHTGVPCTRVLTVVAAPHPGPRPRALLPPVLSFHRSGERRPLPPSPSSVVDVSLSAFSVLLGDRTGREWLCLGLDTSSATCWASLVA